MQIKRDYSRPLFTGRRRTWATGRVLFMFGVMLGTMMIFVYTNFEDLQSTALDAIGLSPTTMPLPGDLATFASNLVRAGDVDEAAALFEQALEQRPDNPDYLHEYGQVLIEQGNYLEAVVQADHMLQLNPNDVRGYALKARALVFADNATSAIPIALSSISIDDSYAPAYSALSRAYTNDGQYLDGVENGLSAVEADPGDVEARRAYAYALSWISDNDEAINQLEVALALDPSYIPTHFELALQYVAQNRDQEAIDLYARVLAIQPRNARAMLRLCETYRKVGQFQRAVGYCEDSVQNDPNSIGAQYQLGILKYMNRDFAGALEAFSNCNVLDPENLDCMYRMGLSYYYVDDCDRGWALLQESLLLAQNSAGNETIIANIREGLTAIGEKCLYYRDKVPEENNVPPNA